MDTAGRAILCNYQTQETYGSWRPQRGSITRPAPAAWSSAAQRGDHPAGFAGDAGPAVWQGGMSMRGGRAARTVYLYNLAQAARPRRSALRAGRACPTGARACRADRADAGLAGSDFRDQPGAVE